VLNLSARLALSADQVGLAGSLGEFSRKVERLNWKVREWEAILRSRGFVGS
jgi:hypothetical protein